jgi:Double-GTPase 2
VSDGRLSGDGVTRGEASPVGNWLELPDGGDLGLAAAESMVRAAVTRVVVLAGPADSGKTMLLTTLYECFQRGPFAGYVFAGCRSFLGFERRCHLSRIESGRVTPETARTAATTESRWLHLRVRPASLDGPGRDLLLTELPGDLVRLAKDSTDECRRLTLSRRADHFVILLDGARLGQRQHRFTTANDAALLVRSCLDAEMLGRFSFVDLVFTKWDLATAGASAEEMEQFVAAFTERTRLHCGGRLGRLRFLQVAARPGPGSPLAFAHGLAELFSAWVQDSPAFGPAHRVPVPLPESASEFDRYLWRRLPELRPAG